MTVGSAIDILNSLASNTGHAANDAGAKLAFEKAQRIALGRAAEAARVFIVSRMQREWPPSSAGGEFPAKRTGSLANSIVTQVGDTEFVFKKQKSPAGRWQTSMVPVNSKTHTAYVMVSPTAMDTSKGHRLQRYSKYLQTGWVINTTQKRMYEHVGTPGHVSRKKRKKGIRVPGTVQPPRPFLEQVILLNFSPTLVNVYRKALRDNLPGPMQGMADKAGLTVTYNPPTY